jgi:hypothetical protein
MSQGTAAQKLHIWVAKNGTHKLAALLISANPDRSDSVDLSCFSRVLCSAVPSLTPAETRFLFEAHAARNAMPRLLSIRRLAATLEPETRPADQSTAEAAEQPRRKQAWEAQPTPTTEEGPAYIVPDTFGAAPTAASTHAIALSQFTQALAAEAAARGAASALPRSERLTMHQRQADAAERQLVLLGLLRAVEPRASVLTEAQLTEVLRVVARRAAAGGATRPATSRTTSAVPFLEVEFIRSAWRRAVGGDVRKLLDVLCPIPIVRGSSAAAAGAAAEEKLSGADHVGPALLNGPFDRGSGKLGSQRRGARVVNPPRELPSVMKYRHCRTPLLVPPGFDSSLITRSAQHPRWKLERKAVHGYNGLGKHNRS